MDARDRYRFGIVESLIYSIETVLSTTVSVETFNESLEINAKEVSQEFNLLISKYYSNIIRRSRKLFKKLELFVGIISKARSISPCEDIATSMEAHVQSQTAIKAIKKLKDHGLEELIRLARYRMRNYGYFLQTGHDIVIAQREKFRTGLVVFMTAIILIATIFMAIKGESINIWKWKISPITQENETKKTQTEEKDKNTSSETKGSRVQTSNPIEHKNKIEQKNTEDTPPKKADLHNHR